MTKNEYINLLEAHRDRIFSYALYALRDREDAEDVTQEVFLRLWRQGSQLELDNAEAWLVRVANNLCIDNTRRRKTVRKHLGRAETETLEQLPQDRSSWNDPEAALGRSDNQRTLLQAMGTLPEETRNIMLMHYFQGLRLQDIASALGKKTSTVKVQIHRARKALRLVLESGADMPLTARRETG
jgi:RNA polymerase sigma factor (sigma-70 family)